MNMLVTENDYREWYEYLNAGRWFGVWRDWELSWYYGPNITKVEI